MMFYDARGYLHRLSQIELYLESITININDCYGNFKIDAAINCLFKAAVIKFFIMTYMDEV